MKLSYRFSDYPIPGVEEVGGKAASLMRLFQAGHPVPPGFILTTSFFQPWLADLRTAREWDDFVVAEPATLAVTCSRLQGIIEKRCLSADQHQLLAEELGHWQTDSVFAVRSSSTEEDMESASFAGAYRTVLGVNADRVPANLPAIIASSLDHRTVLYKIHRGIDPTRPRLAVIIQEQVASDVSGVAFSANPVAGDMTQVVVESSLGLGTAVVEGRVSPDHFVIDKRTRKILNRRGDSVSLTEERLQALVTLVLDVEREYQRPIDIEWAVKSGRIFLLQARPITALPTGATNPTKG
ncbi:MAG TPA: PEP/pyruvate-binding domain-containing protein [Nitrospirales bacterium]